MRQVQPLADAALQLHAYVSQCNQLALAPADQGRWLAGSWDLIQSTYCLHSNENFSKEIERLPFNICTMQAGK
jgi:hypothetical protein